MIRVVARPVLPHFPRVPDAPRRVVAAVVVGWMATVGWLADEIGLSQSALSQHLARMREEGIVTFRRDAQTLWYRIADRRIESLLATLHRLYCRD